MPQHRFSLTRIFPCKDRIKDSEKTCILAYFLQRGETPEEFQELSKVEGGTTISLSGAPANLTTRSRRQLEAEDISF